MVRVDEIEKLIEKHGINWSILAKKIGLSRQSMEYLKKRQKTSIETLTSIAEYFKVDVKSLLTANKEDYTTINNESMLPDVKFYQDIIKTYQEKVEALEEELIQYRRKEAKKKDVS